MWTIRIAVALALYSTGCGGCGEPRAKPDGRELDADAPIDGAPDAPPPCDVTKPFGAPMLVPGVNTTGSETGGWMSPDQLTIYFTRTTGMGDIYVATRPTPADPFTTGVKLAGIDTPTLEEEPALTADGLVLFFTATPVGTSPHIYTASRTSTSASFSAASDVTSVNASGADDESPWISGDGLVIYFASSRIGPDTDLFMASRSVPTAAFSTPIAQTVLNDPASDSFPVVSADGLEIFFASDRGGTGTGARPNDIWHATRASTTDDFGVPVVEAEVSDAAGNDGPTWLSDDRCLLVFSTNRAGGVGSYDIWMARRP